MKNFQKLFFKLAESLLVKFPKPPDKNNLKSVFEYYPSFATIADFCLVGTAEKQILKIMQDVKSSKAAGVDKLSGRFLKNGANILPVQNQFLLFVIYQSPEESFQVFAKLRS